MKRVLALAVSAGLLSGAAFAASPWDGTYLFEQPIGPGSGGMQLFINHTLVIGPNRCTIVALGYQTNSEIRCKATPNGDRLDVAFVSYSDDTKLRAKYQPNEKLFTLTKKGNAITTSWAGYSMNKTIGAAPGEDTFKKTSDQAQLPKRM
jgi:hypothetical protein